MRNEEIFESLWIKHNKGISDESLHLYLSPEEIDLVHEAMDEYAKEMAIGFAHYIHGGINPIYVSCGAGKWKVFRPSPTFQPTEYITDEQLYNLYLLTINEK